jgi:hypothetical protein
VDQAQPVQGRHLTGQLKGTGVGWVEQQRSQSVRRTMVRRTRVRRTSKENKEQCGIM